MALQKKLKEVGRFYGKNVLVKKRISFFLLVNIALFIIIAALLFIRFKGILFTILFCAIIFIIRYERQRLGIPITFEPVILFSVVLVRAYGFAYGAFAATLPILLSDVLSGRLRPGTLISAGCKILVLIPVYLFGGHNLFLVTIISYILLNEGIGTILGFRSGAEPSDILTQLATSTIIRVVYLQLFLGPLCLLTGAAC